MRMRPVRQEHEAQREPAPASPCPTARGKAEWKVYGDGTRQGKVTVAKLSLPDGAILDLVVDDQRITQLIVQRGMARFRRETVRGEDVPGVE